MSVIDNCPALMPRDPGCCKERAGDRQSRGELDVEVHRQPEGDRAAGIHTWGQVIIPYAIAKKGNGKAVRIPTVIRERLESFRVEGNPFAFAGFADEVERSLKTCHAVKSFSPKRMLWRMQKLIKQGALAIGRPEITHHALRRTLTN